MAKGHFALGLLGPLEHQGAQKWSKKGPFLTKKVCFVTFCSKTRHTFFVKKSNLPVFFHFLGT